MYRRVASFLVGGAVLLALYPAVRIATAQPQATSLLFVQTAQKIDYKDGEYQVRWIPRPPFA